MPRVGRDHPSDPRRRHHDRVDRAHRARAGVNREPVVGDELRAGAGPGRAARRDGGGACQGGLHGDSGLMTLLQTCGLCAFYGDFQALFDINVSVEEGETVAVIGSNGAGKTTLLRAVAGALLCNANMVTFAGRPIGALSAHQIVRLGIAMVPEGRRLFPSLTVEENLKLGAYASRSGAWNLD